MFLPVRNRPLLDSSPKDFIYQIPNALSSNVINSLKDYALNKETSGLNKRRGYIGLEGSFSTCLISDYNHEIYQKLDNLWHEYGSKLNKKLEFIEPYEIKCYNVFDRFDIHKDNYGYLSTNVDRKVSLSIQLSDINDYKGGQLTIGDVKCNKEIGTAVFFPSSYYHRVEPITKGQRFALISWAWGPN